MSPTKVFEDEDLELFEEALREIEIDVDHDIEISLEEGVAPRKAESSEDPPSIAL